MLLGTTHSHKGALSYTASCRGSFNLRYPSASVSRVLSLTHCMSHTHYYHEAHSQTTTETTSLLFRTWLSRPKDGCHRCRPLRRASLPYFTRTLPNTSTQVLNKVAGVYGLMAMLTGAGGNAAQLTLYLYSVVALAGLAWGIRTINDVCSNTILFRPFCSPLISPRRIRNTCSTLPMYSLPIISSTPHGPYILPFAGGYIPPMTAGAMRTPLRSKRSSTVTSASTRICPKTNVPQLPSASGAPRKRRRSPSSSSAGLSRSVIPVCLSVTLNDSLPYHPTKQFYFAALLYSFALHLRRGNYRALRSNGTAASANTPLANEFSALPAPDSDNGGDDNIETDVDLESFYVPTPTAINNNNNGNGTGSRASSASAHRSRSSGAGSAGSFADFVSAPPPRRTRPTRGSLLAGGGGHGTRRSGSNQGSVAGSSSAGPSEGEDDEVSSAGTGNGRAVHA